MKRRKPLTIMLIIAGVGGGFAYRAYPGSHGMRAELVREEDHPFAEALIGNDYQYGFGLAVADLDRDGDLDLTSADALPVGSLYWYENDGRGKFLRHDIQRDSPKWLERQQITDMNGDGWLDVVAVRNLSGDVVWFENPGTRLSEGLSWRPHFITEGGLPYAYDLAVGDVDGDGKTDVVASSSYGDRFVWFENRGGDRWQIHSIGRAKEARGVGLADFNGDGKPDVLGVGSNEGSVNWFDRIDADHWTQHLIDASPRPCHRQVVDFDGDGDTDVVMAFGFGSRPWRGKSDEQVAWLENLDHGIRWTKHVVADRFGRAFETVASDLDADGDLDLVATAWGDGSVAWFENPGKWPRPWRMHSLKANWMHVNQVVVSDLDGDGRNDVVAVAERGNNELRWWRNLGKRAGSISF